MKKPLYFLFLFSFLLLIDQKLHGQNFSNKGRDFWVAYTGHIDSTRSRMALYISSQVDTKGKVEVNGVTQDFVVKANTITTVQLTSTSSPISNTIAINTQYEGVGINRGIHITADNNVVVYAHILNAARSGSTLVLPTNVLGREYIASSYQSNNSTGNSLRNTEFAVIGIQNNTTIEVTPTASDVNGLHPINTPFTVILNKGDVYQYQSTGDITGTKIRSIATNTSTCQQISVYSGSTWTSMGCTNASSGDNLYQQLFPINAWGKTFLTAPAANKRWDIFRILVQDPNTTVQVNGVTLAKSSLINNAYYEFNTLGNNTYRSITADGPICVLQYFVTQVCDNVTGDPEMIILSPIEQTINDVVVMSARNDLTPPNTNITAHFLNIIFKTNSFSSLTIDGAAPKATPIVMGTTGYSYIQENVTQSTTINPYHRVVSDSGFMCIAYGLGNVESYGYNAGTNVKDLYQTLTVDNPLGNVKLPATCIGTPFDVNMTLPYIPLSIKWIIPFYKDTIVDNAPQSTSSSVINNKTIYSFKLNKKLIIDTAGNYVIQVIVNNPLADGCSGEQSIDFAFQVYNTPRAGFQIFSEHCATRNNLFKDTVVLNKDERPVIKWDWDFGNGNFNETNIDSIFHIYATAGNFTTRYFVITDIGCISDTLTAPLIIDNLPNLNFAINGLACEKKGVNLNNLSQNAGNIALINSIWDFGDGKKRDSLQNISNGNHIYDTAGSYNVLLQSTTQNGCTDSLIKNIRVNNLPVAKVILPLICLRDSIASFINQSYIVGNEALRFNWNFGDFNNLRYPNTDTAKNPSHKYTNVGNYDITLVTTALSGCTDTSNIVFTVNGSIPKVDFSFINDTALCSNKLVVLHNNATIDFGNNYALKILWDINQANPYNDTTYDAHATVNTEYPFSYQKKISYPNQFDFNVKLIAYSGGTCADSLTKSIHIVPPPSAPPIISSSNPYTCQFDSVQLFANINDGTPPFKYIWSTKNTNAKIQTNTLYGLKADTISYSVEVIDKKQCSYLYDSIGSIIVRSIPDAQIISKDTIICNLQPIILKANSLSNIVSYQWYLNQVKDTLTNIDSIFIKKPGYYTVVNNDGYCNSLASSPMYIQAINIPMFHITHTPYICVNTALPIQTDAYEMKYVHYLWDFGDSTTANLAKALTHTYKKASAYAMQLKVSNDFCPDSTMNYTIKSDSVWVISPINPKEITMFILKYTDSLLQPKVDSGYTQYYWTPSLYLDNDRIQHPLFHAVTNVDYDLYRTDTVTNCQVKDLYHIISSDEVAINVPKAFTPNNDNLNDILKLEYGAGIKQFNYFTIFNRWGKMIFTTTNINKGWDGRFDNEPQLMDMYSYILDYITYKEEHIQKTGSFILIR